MSRGKKTDVRVRREKHAGRFRLAKLEERIAPKGGRPSRGCVSGDPGTAICVGPY